MKAFIKDKIWNFYITAEQKKVREKLKNKEFTLITPNCMGGWMYHMLGVRFDSPTINIYFNKKEYLKFVSDLHYYMEQKLDFYEKEGQKAPCAHLGEDDRRISKVFTHYKTQEEAEAKWNERKARIHWDNLYILATDGEGTEPQDFEVLEHVDCRRKIVFVSRTHPEISDSFLLNTIGKKPTANSLQLTQNVLTGLRGWEYEFDYPAWLNGEESFRKEYPRWIHLFMRH